MRICYPYRFVAIGRKWTRAICRAVLAIAGLMLVADVAFAQADASALFQQARENFKPVTDEQLADARADLNTRVKDVERYVRPSSRNGKEWLRYLQWDAFKQQLAADGPPELGPFAATYARLNRDEDGLDRAVFRRTSDALRRYSQLLQISQRPDPAEYYATQLERLETQLDEYRREPTADTGAQIGSRLGFIADLEQSPELVAEVRRELARPNAFVDVATSLVAAAAEPVDRREPVTDCILGTNIRSDAHTVGTVAVASIPSDDKAVLEFHSEGRVRARSVGHNDPAVIHSTSHTDYTATKRVELSDATFAARPSRAHANTDTNIHSVAKQGGGLGSRIVSNIGWKRARQSEGRAEAIAADHAEDRIERRFNDELNDDLREARRRYEDEYRRPLARRGELPEHIRFSSDKDSLGVEVIQANRGQLAASSGPPEAPVGHDLTMRLHESAVNNYSASLLGGATARETEPGQDVKFDVKLPDWMKDAWGKRKTEPDDQAAAEDEPFKQWSLTFRRDRPLTVNFADEKVKLTIRIAQLKSGEKSFSNWDVTGVYTPELADGGIILRRDGDLEMLPADFKGTLTNRQVAERGNLEKELNERSAQGRGFPKEIEFEALEPDGALADAGPLGMNQCISDGGWLTLAWDRMRKRNR